MASSVNSSPRSSHSPYSRSPSPEQKEETPIYFNRQDVEVATLSRKVTFFNVIEPKLREIIREIAQEDPSLRPIADQEEGLLRKMIAKGMIDAIAESYENTPEKENSFWLDCKKKIQKIMQNCLKRAPPPPKNP